MENSSCGEVNLFYSERCRCSNNYPNSITITISSIFVCIFLEQQLMDRPFDGTTIDGPRQQEIKPGSTITLSCRAIISLTNENENNNGKISRKDGTHRSKRVVWSVNNIPITLQVQLQLPQQT